MRQLKKLVFVMTFMVVLGGLLSGCKGAKDKKIAIGSKNFTEQLILGNMYADLIEANTDLEVDRKSVV